MSKMDDKITLVVRRFAGGDANGTPRDVIMSVEDWIDYPPNTVSERMADKILEALDAAGYYIQRHEESADRP
jgi:hypothetical protein